MADFKVMALSEGTIFCTVNGENLQLVEVKEAKAEVELNKEEWRPLGSRMTKHKVTGGSGSGDLTSYTFTSRWAQMLAHYKETGSLPVMTFTGISEDKQADNGKQVVTISGVMFDKIPLFGYEADDGVQEDEMGFTFDDFVVTESFKEKR